MKIQKFTRLDLLIQKFFDKILKNSKYLSKVFKFSKNEKRTIVFVSKLVQWHYIYPNVT